MTDPTSRGEVLGRVLDALKTRARLVEIARPLRQKLKPFNDEISKTYAAVSDLATQAVRAGVLKEGTVYAYGRRLFKLKKITAAAEPDGPRYTVVELVVQEV